MSVVEWLWPPPVPVIVIGYVPVGAFLATVSVKSVVPEPGAPIEVGLKLPVTPDGIPLAENEMDESNPPETFVVTTPYPLWPWSRYPEVGEAERVKVQVSPSRLR